MVAWWLALQIVVQAGPWVGLDAEALRQPLAELHAREPNYLNRLLHVSRQFLGAPYQFSPLGEAAPPDADPLFVTNTFDCLSLVEISLAMAAEPQIDRALQRLNGIRYFDGRVDFGQRKHLMESQWIPANSEWLHDITQDVAGDLAVSVHKTITPATWAKRKQALDLNIPKERLPNGTFTWKVVPLDKVNEVAAKIPTGTLLFIVRDDYHSTPYRISHVGIVIQKKAGTFLRHAKDQGVHMVLDMPLADVVKRHQQFVKWPATGVSLYLPKLASPPR